MDENKESLNVSDLSAHLPALATGLSGEDRSGLVSALKNNKLQSLAGLHSDVLENLNPKVGKRKRVELLREIQSQHDELKAKFFEERAALEAKYHKIYEPLYKKRYEIVNGVVEVENVAKENAEETKTDDKGLPSFWLTAMKTNDVLTEEIHKPDVKALKFLKDIKWSRIDDPKGFKLEFFFNSNPYFKNSVLTITYHMINDDKPIVEKVIGTKIEWYPGKCLTRMILKKTNAKPFPKKDYKSYCKSFFNFFNTLRVLEDDELINQMEYDYYIGSTIRDKIIPHAVSWFTGEAAQDDNLQDLMGDDDGEDNDEDEEEDDADEYEEGELEEWFTEIYYVCSGNMSSDSSQKQRLRNPQMSGGYTQQGYHEPRPPTWGPPGESQMQSQMSGAYTLQGYHEPRPPTWGPPGGSQISAGYTQQGYYEPQPPTSGPPGGSQMQSQMSGAYTRQGYHEPRPPTWGPPGGSQMQSQMSGAYTWQGSYEPRPPTWDPPGGSKMQQQPGYGYMQPGSYPTQPQYYMYPSSYPLQSSNQQTQQTATKTGLITMASNSNRNISEFCVDGTTRND